MNNVYSTVLTNLYKYVYIKTTFLTEFPIKIYYELCLLRSTNLPN
jgi:hypothetical protein